MTEKHDDWRELVERARRWETEWGNDFDNDALIKELANALANAIAARDRAIHDGALRRCDVPACNCNGYHSRYASRMLELDEEVQELREQARADERAMWQALIIRAHEPCEAARLLLVERLKAREEGR